MVGSTFIRLIVVYMVNTLHWCDTMKCVYQTLEEDILHWYEGTGEWLEDKEYIEELKAYESLSELPPFYSLLAIHIGEYATMFVRIEKGDSDWVEFIYDEVGVEDTTFVIYSEELRKAVKTLIYQLRIELR